MNGDCFGNYYHYVNNKFNITLITNLTFVNKTFKDQICLVIDYLVHWSFTGIKIEY